MLSIGGSSRIYLYTPPTDMRKSFRGLSALVYGHLGQPQDGSYFVFVNRRRTHVKVLAWDGDGLVIWYKRLERGQFIVPSSSGVRLELDRRRLGLMLEGITPLRLQQRYVSPSG